MHPSIKRIDAHAHLAYPITNDSLERVLALTQADAVCLAALPGTARLDPTLDLLCYKHAHPDTTFVFGCLDCTVYEHKPQQCGRLFVKHAKRLLKEGCDGVKLLEGKPTMRRAYDIPDFDAPAWEPFWAYAEKTRLPILMHVNDPASFWDPDAIPAHARAEGWGYTAADVQAEAQYRQMRAVLEKHPQLNITFPHMFFLSADLPRLSEWLDRFTLMHVDLTPGIELYETLSRTPEETRAFFKRYVERIHYGTDIGGRATLNGTQTSLNEGESLRRAEICTAFLEDRAVRGVRADGAYLIDTEPFVLNCLALDQDALTRIYRDNFLAFVGCDTPRAVNVTACLRACKRLKRRLTFHARLHETKADTRAADSNRRYFQHAKEQ